ncbi:hypothetical protein [Clostridium akagii]|uniref:hypothetical protein n=1 Tax=Clostridium akagii TaxID=91623 RepID=UPI000A666716|nr:hypothetical protein [Clostridium akagii]
MQNNYYEKTKVPTILSTETQIGLVRDSSNPLYKIPIFLSYATPYNKVQMLFLNRIIENVKSNLLFPRTLGGTDQYTETNMISIRRMILSTFGMMSVAFHRVYVKEAISRKYSPAQHSFKDFWLSSPYLQIEPSMAFQHGLPLMLMMEKGNNQDVTQNSIFGGIYAPNSMPLNIIIFDLTNEDTINDFFASAFWNEAFMNWVGQVRNAYAIKTEPDFKYEC